MAPPVRSAAHSYRLKNKFPLACRHLSVQRLIHLYGNPRRSHDEHVHNLAVTVNGTGGELSVPQH